MTYEELKRAVSKETGNTKQIVSHILDTMIDEILKAFVDTDVVELGPLGVMEFQYLPPAKSDEGEYYTGRIRFKVAKRALKFLVNKNMEMIALEEQE